MKHLVVRDNGETLGSSVYRTAQAAIATERSKEGSNLPEIRKWRFNLVSSYHFTEGRLKPWAVGGAIRWQDKGAVGYHAFRNEYGQVVQDVHRPIYGPGEFDTDVFVSYSKRILENRVRWKVQLNVYNVLNDRKEIPTAIDDDLVVVASRVQNPLTFKLSSTFEF
jgi:outer membrane receptor protein involved in Fe transport